MDTHSDTKPIWDLAIRLFHWTLVVSFITSYLSSEEESLIHIYSGYLIICLVIFRLIYGVIGSKHARFSDFVYGPQKIIAYTKGMLKGQVNHVQGHNPLGGLMVVALLASLVLTTVTGLKVYGVEGHGPLAASQTTILISSAYASVPSDHDMHEDNEDAEHFWEEIHEFFANFTVFLIVFHILGVVVSSRIEKQNLVQAMITGYKRKSLE